MRGELRLDFLAGPGGRQDHRLDSSPNSQQDRHKQKIKIKIKKKSQQDLHLHFPVGPIRQCNLQDQC